MKFIVEFRDSKGIRVSEREWARRLKRDVVRMAEANLGERIRSVRCPIHGQTPRSIRSSTSGSRLQWQWVGCCANLNHTVERALGVQK